MAENLKINHKLNRFGECKNILQLAIIDLMNYYGTIFNDYRSYRCQKIFLYNLLTSEYNLNLKYFLHNYKRVKKKKVEKLDQLDDICF